MDFVSNTYIDTFKNDARDRIETEVGDSKQEVFYPQLKIKRWDNEVNFSIRLKEDSPSSVFDIADGKVSYDNIDKSAHFYPLGNGHEFEVVLKEQPKSNVIEFTIQSKGLDFFYQPELTEQEIIDGCMRPDNVVGSYAVYHSTKANNNTKGKTYFTGKFCHIYRPKAIDSEGIETWCDLFIDIEKEIATITIPQKFLDNAAYPIVIDPEFGFHTKGGSVSGFVGNYQIGCDFTLSVDGTANFLSMWCKRNDATATQIQFGIYSGNTLKGNTGSVDMPTDATGNWCPNNNVISGGSLTAGTLRLCFNHNAVSPALWYDSTAINGGYQSKAFGSWSDPASWSTYNNLKWSIYCDYTAASAGTNYTKTLTDSITVNDADGTHGTKADSITVTDSQTKKPTVKRADTVSMADSRADVFQALRTLTDNISMSDFGKRKLTLRKGDNITMADLFKLSRIGKSLANSVTISDSITKIRGMRKALPDNITVVDFIRLVTSGLYEDSVSILDGIKLLIRLAEADSVSITDSYKKTIGLPQSDTVSISDSITKVIGIFRADNITTVDLFIPAGQGVNYKKTLTETIPLSDFIAFVKSFIRLQEDDIAIAEQIYKRFSFGNADNISVTDNINFILNYNKIFNENIALSEQIGKVIQRLFEDSVSLSDVTFKATRLFKTDNISLSEYLDYIQGYYKTLTDTVIISEAVLKAIQTELADSIILSDEDIRKLFIGMLYRPDGNVWVRESLKALVKKQIGEDKVFQWESVELLVPRGSAWNYIDISG
jgi:hypothetical protein